MFLTGDHNLGNGNPPTQVFDDVPPSIFFTSLGTNFAGANSVNGVGWADNMHSKQGNVGLADGSVQGFSKTRLQEALQNSGDTGTTAGLFSLQSPNSPLGVNRIQLP
jgi:prepilin-type processing-associated H-X9-DG protein